jgi:hypothetical protein
VCWNLKVAGTETSQNFFEYENQAYTGISWIRKSIVGLVSPKWSKACCFYRRLVQAGATDAMSALDMSEIEEELLSTHSPWAWWRWSWSFGSGCKHAGSEHCSRRRLCVQGAGIPERSQTIHGWAVILENLQDMERHVTVEPAAALIKDLTAMHISVQSSIHAFFPPATRPDSDSGGCAAGGRAN